MNLRTRSTVVSLLVTALGTLMPSLALADGWGVLMESADCPFTTGRITAACIPLFIGHLVEFVFGLVGIFFILNVMYAGYQLALGYMGSGDKGDGKARLTWSVIGLIASVCSYLILDLVLYVVLG